ncbi:MAG: Uma2 family endonuclease [Gemmataceae bacterium]|nr:Uma2 family endonuclease [Gemmataceae bacterium]
MRSSPDRAPLGGAAVSAITPAKPPVHYPADDGLPMSDNTVQFRWILIMQVNLEIQFRNDPNVFVAGNHLIYPREEKKKVRQAPDVYVAFGRPKGDRSSYQVWEEGGVFPQVVFEVWSPGNRYPQMRKKFDFYQKYGAEEYYILYPEFPAHVDAWRREAGKFVKVPKFADWVSPRLGIRFGRVDGELFVRGPGGGLFRPPAELAAEREEIERALAAERAVVEAERQRAAEAARRAEEETRRAAAAADRADKFAAKLRELGIDPDAV